MRGVGWLVLGLGLAGASCSIDAAGIGPPGTGADATATATSTETTTAADATTADASSTSSTTDASATGDASSGSGSTDGTTASEPEGLLDTGLLARWYIDEAEADQRIERLVDSHAPAVDLALDYHGNSPSFAVVDGNRGLQWPEVGQNGRPQAPIMGNKLYDDLGGASEVTFELVLAVQEVDTDTSRFLHFGDGNQSGDFVIGSDDPGLLELRWDGIDSRRFAATFTGARQVLHVVVDTSEGGPENRFRAYLDGVELASMGSQAPALGAGLPLDPSSSLVLGNRADGQRSFRGTLHYAAIYRAAFEPEDVAHDTAVLLASDDAPG